MRAKAFSRLAFAFALASLASTFTLAAADECGASSSGRIRAQGLRLATDGRFDRVVRGQCDRSSQRRHGERVTSTVANTYNGGACFFSQVESHNNYLQNAQKLSVTGHGATKAVDVLSGGTSTKVLFSGGRYVSGTYQDWRHSFRPQWTFCTMARYSGATKKRIFKGTTTCITVSRWQTRRVLLQQRQWLWGSLYRHRRDCDGLAHSVHA